MAKNKRFVPEIKVVPVAELNPYERNARTHTDAQIQQIMESIEAFCFVDPIIINSEKGVLSGHGRLEAAKRLGYEEVPTICCPDHLDEKEQKALILALNKIAANAGWDIELLKMELAELSDALNKIAANAGWDIELLKMELAELSDAGFDVKITGFTDEELFNFFPGEKEEVELKQRFGSSSDSMENNLETDLLRK